MVDSRDLETVAPPSAAVEEAVQAYLADPASRPDILGVFAELRERSPVHRLPSGPWVVTGFAAAEDALRSPAFSRLEASTRQAEQLVAAGGPQAAAAVAVFRRWFLNLDPPDHTRLRRLASPALRPKVVEGMRAHVEEVVEELVAELALGEPFDFKERFAFEVPHRIICDVLGVPPSDQASWRTWVETLSNANQTYSAPDHFQRLTDALTEFEPYCRELVARREVMTADGAGDDLLSALIAAERTESDVDVDDLVATLMLLIVAGHVTTVNLLTSGMLLLLEHPEQWTALRDEPVLASSAVEEALRFEPPARVNLRIALEDVVVGGVTIPRGDGVLVLIPAANRDPARFPAPDEFDIRRPGPAHLAFGLGAHFCLGAPLARLEASIAFERLAGAVDVRQHGEVRWSDHGQRVLEQLWIEAVPSATPPAPGVR